MGAHEQDRKQRHIQQAVSLPIQVKLFPISAKQFPLLSFESHKLKIK